MVFSVNAENDEFQIIQSLKLNREKRNKHCEIFVEGIECIKQALNANVEITRIIVNDINTLSNWGKSVVQQTGAKTLQMPDELFSKLAEKTEPSEMLITAKIRRNTLDDIDASSPFLVVFDRPGDHGNLGSVIRSANAFNADALLITGHGADAYDPKAIRASLGSVFFTKTVLVESMESLEEFIALQKKKNGMEVIGTDSEGTVSIKNICTKKPVMIVIGNEAKGMSVRLKEKCDRIIKIPIEGNVNSLNVSSAASIVMWEIYKNSGCGSC